MFYFIGCIVNIKFGFFFVLVLLVLQFSVVCNFEVNMLVELWYQIIDLIFFCLVQCICIKCIIGIDVGLSGRVFGVFCLIVLYFKWVDFKFCVGGMFFECGVDYFNQLVNIIVLLVSDCVELSFVILFEGQVVGEWCVCYWVGIEVVIKVDVVNIILAGDFSNYGIQVLFYLWQFWIEVVVVVVRYDLVVVLIEYLIG